MQRTTPVREFGRRNLPESVQQTGRRGSILAVAHARREAKEAERLAREAAERQAYEKLAAERQAARQALIERLDPRESFLRTAQKTIEVGLKGGQRSMEIAADAVAAGRDGLDQAGEACEAGLRHSREALETLNAKLKSDITDSRNHIDAGVRAGRDGLADANLSLHKSLKANGEQLSTRVSGAVDSLEEGVKGGRAALERLNQKLNSDIANNRDALRDGLDAGRSGLDSANTALKKGLSTGQESIKGANAALAKRIEDGRQTLGESAERTRDALATTNDRLARALKTTGEGLVGGLAEGLAEGLKEGVEALKDSVDAIEVGLKGSRTGLEDANSGLARRISSGRNQVRQGLQAGKSGVDQARLSLRQKLADGGKTLAETSRALDAKISARGEGLREDLKDGLSSLDQANARLVGEIGKKRVAINGAIDASVTNGRQAITDAQSSLGEAAAAGHAVVRQAAPKALDNLLWIAGTPVRGLGHLVGFVIGGGARFVGLITGLLIVLWTRAQNAARATANWLGAAARKSAFFAVKFAALTLRTIRLVGRRSIALARLVGEKFKIAFSAIWRHLREMLAWLSGFDWQKVAFRAAPASLAAIAIFFAYRADIDWQSMIEVSSDQPRVVEPAEPAKAETIRNRPPVVTSPITELPDQTAVLAPEALAISTPAEIDAPEAANRADSPPPVAAPEVDTGIADQIEAEPGVRVHRDEVPEAPVLTAAARIIPNLRPKPDVPGRTERPAATVPVKGGRIAIVIDDMGMDLRNFNRFMALPAEINFAFLPYAENLHRLTSKASANGHEMLVHMPMEPKSGSEDPGPNALLTGLPDIELARRITWNLERFDGFVGINNHMGSRFTENLPGMNQVMGELKERKLLYLDSLTTPSSTGYDIASDIGVNRVKRDIFLDNEREVQAILKQLRRAADIAERYGQSVAIGHPYKQTYEALTIWLAEIEGRSDIGLAPISALATPVSPTKLASSNSASE